MSKKTAYAVMAALFLLSILALKVDIQSARAEPRTWTVDDDGPADFHIIQRAINSASDGDSVYVYSGIYYEHLVIDKSIVLLGESKESTIVDGRGENRNVIDVTAKNVAISGFTVQNSSRTPGTSYAGIKTSGRTCNLTGNHITKNKIGILMTSQKSRIAENSIKNNGQGIALYDCSEVRVEANNFTANTYGISLARSFNNMIVGNRVTKSSFGGHGIYLSSGSSNNTISSNDLINNYHGIWLSGSFKNWIVENTIANNELLGIELTDSRDNIIYHNNFFNNTKHVVVNQPNTWHDGYPSGGNYWHDYSDVDEKSGPNQDQLNSDGIWDNPYVINENNLDRYPSVRPYGEISDIIPDKTKPTANAGPDQTVKVGTPAYFNASRSTGNIVRYEWDFGDGTRGEGVTCSHIYNETGTYNVTLTVKDAEETSNTDLLTVTVVPVEASPLWVNTTAVVIVIAIVAALFWKYKVSKKTKKKRMRKLVRAQKSETYRNIHNH